MRLKAVSYVAVLLLIGLMAIAYTVVKSIDFNAYKDLVAQQVKVALGRDLIIGGDITVEIGFVPHLTARQITLHNADWSDQPQMASIDQLDAQLELLPLLFDQIRIRQITLNGGKVLLERNDKGVGNWSFGGAESGGSNPLLLPQVGRIRIENVQLRYRDPVRDLDKSLQVDHFAVEPTSSIDSIAWSLSGRTAKNVIDLSGITGAVNQMTNGRFPIDVSGKVGDVTVQSHATISHLSTLKGIDIDVQVSGSDLARTNSLFGLELPQTSVFKISTHLTDEDKGYHLDRSNIIFGKSSLNGDIHVFIDRDRPLVRAKLSSDHLDLADFGFTPADIDATRKTENSRLFSMEPWNLSFLHAVDADIELNVGELLRGRPVLKNGKATAKLEHGILTVQSFTAIIDQGQIDLAGSLHDGDKPALDIQAKAANIASGPLLTGIGLSDVLTVGAVNLDLSVKGPATSEHDLMSGLSGKLHFNAGAGTLQSRFAEILFADLAKIVTFGGTADAAKVNCVAGEFDIDNGVAQTNNLVMDTPGAAVLGQGSINLGAEVLHMQVDPKSKQVSLATLAVPILVSGQLQHPTVVPDAVGAIVNTGDFVASTANTVTFGMLNDLIGLGGNTGTSNACATVADAAVKKATADSKVKQGAAAIGNGTKQFIQGVGEGAGSTLKGVGNEIKSGLQSVFGN